MSGIQNTFAPHASALTPNARDLEVIRAALAWLIALLSSPFVRLRRAAAEARAERLALAARRAALLAYSPPAGLQPIPTASVPVAPFAPVQFVAAPPAALDVIDVAEPTAPAVWHVGEEPAAPPPAVIDPPAAPAKRTRKTPAARKPTAKKAAPAKKAPAPRKPSVKKAANPPADPPARTPRKRKTAPAGNAAAEPVKTQRKRKAGVGAPVGH